MATSFVAGSRQAALTISDEPQRNYVTPTDHDNASAAYTRHDDSDMSFKFTLSIPRFLMPYIGIIIRCHQKMFENDIEPAGVSNEMPVSCHNTFPVH